MRRGATSHGPARPRVTAGAVSLFLFAAPGVDSVADAQDLARRALVTLRVVDLDGTLWTPERLRGRVTLIDFWATWCAPCLEELPRLKQARAKYSRAEFEVLGVSLDVGDRRRLVSWMNRQGVTWPQVFDGRGRQSPVARQFGVSGVPTSFLVDRGGQIVGVNLRGPRLLAAIDRAVKNGVGSHFSETSEK